MSKQSTPRKGRQSCSQHTPKRSPKRALTVVNPNAAGIDVGATNHYVAVPPDAVADESAVRKFGAFTEDLEQMVEWLKACGVTTVALESTGVDWKPVFQKLEVAGLKPVLVNPKMVKHVPGRKTDVQDCQWLQQLHTYGLLQGSFVPDDLVCQLRVLMRHRANLVSQAAAEIQHIQKASAQMNLHLHHAVSDVTGETGLRILRAILEGQRDPEVLVQLRDPQITKSSKEEMKKALRGEWRDELLFVLRQSLEAWEFYHKQMDQCDEQVQQVIKNFPTAEMPEPQLPSTTSSMTAAPTSADSMAKKKTQQSRKRNDPIMNLVPELTRICGIDLCETSGFRVLTALTVVSEIGLDMSRWRSEKAFSSWLGVCPNHKISGGRILSRSTRKVINRAATALRLAAQGISQTDNWLGLFFRRMKSRLGPAGAITATAHKLACIIYHLLKNKEPYVEIDPVLYAARVDRARLGRLKKQAAAMGYELVQTRTFTE